MVSTLPRKKFDISVSAILLSDIALNLDTFEIMLLDNKCFCQHKLLLDHWISTLDLTILNVFADNNINVTQGFRFIVFESVEKFVGERENAGNHNFLLFQQHFQKASFGSLITRDCLEKGLPFPKQSLVFTCLQYKSLKTLWKKQKSLVMSNLYFSQCFLSNWTTFYHFHQI